MVLSNDNDFSRIRKMPPSVLCFWSPYGRDTAKLSLNTAKELARFTSVLLAELPCMGIPRLALLTQKMDREKNTDTLILEYEKKKAIRMTQVHKESDTLSILSANAYGIPDHPVCSRVELETLIKFPGILINSARQDGINTIIFELQGQLATPMTFFALKKADRILIPVDRPEEAAFALINIKRMIDVFCYEKEKLLILTNSDADVIEEAMRIKGKDGILNLEVIEADPACICTYLAEGTSLIKKRLSFGELFSFLKITKTKEKKQAYFNNSNQDEILSTELRIHL